MPSLDAAASLRLFHLHKVVSALVEDFCTWAISKHPCSGQPHQVGDLSLAENRRIQRAFFRWEIYAQLFGQREGTTRYREYPILYSEQEQARLFVDHLPWHEVEELRCIEEYSMQRYKSIFERVAPHIPKKNYKPPKNHRCGSPPGHDDIIGKYVLSFRAISRTKLSKGLVAGVTSYLSPA